jgi:hypothetical protein
MFLNSASSSLECGVDRANDSLKANCRWRNAQWRPTDGWVGHALCGISEWRMPRPVQLFICEDSNRGPICALEVLRLGRPAFASPRVIYIPGWKAGKILLGEVSLTTHDLISRYHWHRLSASHIRRSAVDLTRSGYSRGGRK